MLSGATQRVPAWAAGMRLDLHWGRIRNFTRNYRRVLAPGFRTQRRHVAIVVGLDFVGASAASALIAFISVFTNRVLVKDAVTVPLLGVELSSRIAELGVLAAGVGLLVTVGALASYWSAVHVRAIGRAVHAETMERLLERLAATREIPGMASRAYAPPDIVQQLLRNAIQIGIAAEMVIRSIRPAAYCVMAGGTLLTMAPILTVSLVPVALATVPLIYWMGSRIIAESRDFFEERVSGYGQRINRLVLDLDGAGVDRCPPQEGGYLRTDPVVASYLDAYDKFVLANDRMNLVVGLSQAVVIAIATLIFGTYVLLSGDSWGRLLAYLIGLTLVVNNLRALVGYLASLNRFYPNVAGFLEFWENTERWIRKPGRVEPPPDLRLCCPDPVLPGAQPECTLRPGNVVHYVTPEPPSRVQYGRFVGPLLGACSEARDRELFLTSSAFASAKSRFVPGTLEQNLALPSDRCWELLETLGAADEVRRLPKGLQTPLTDATWNSFSGVLQRALRIGPLVGTDAAVVFVDWSLLSNLDREECRSIVGLFRHKYLFLWTEQALVIDLVDVGTVVVSGGRNVIGIGTVDWYRNVREKVGEILAERRAEAAPEVDLTNTLLG